MHSTLVTKSIEIFRETLEAQWKVGKNGRCAEGREGGPASEAKRDDRYAARPVFVFNYFYNLIWVRRKKNTASPCAQREEASGFVLNLARFSPIAVPPNWKTLVYTFTQILLPFSLTPLLFLHFFYYSYT